MSCIYQISQFKIFNLDASKQLKFSIQDPVMSRLFYIDPTGVFKVSAISLRTQDTCKDGSCYVPVQISDINGNTYDLSIVVQMSQILKDVQCPIISEASICRFKINTSSFDPSKIHH